MDNIPLQNKDASNKYKKSSKCLLLLLLGGQNKKLDSQGRKKNVFIVSFDTIYTWTKSFP